MNELKQRGPVSGRDERKAGTKDKTRTDRQPARDGGAMNDLDKYLSPARLLIHCLL